MQKKAVRFPYCALAAAGHKVVALAVGALVYGQRGCSLLKLLVVRAAHVYGALHQGFDLGFGRLAGPRGVRGAGPPG